MLVWDQAKAFKLIINLNRDFSLQPENICICDEITTSDHVKQCSKGN